MSVITQILCILCALPLLAPSAIFSQTPDSDFELGLHVNRAQVASVPLPPPDLTPLPPEHSAAKALRRHPVPFSVLFKYDTSWDNPAHRCYEILKPITPTFFLRFNLVSLSQYTVGRGR